MTRRLRHARRLDRRSVRSMTDDQIIGLCGHHPDTRVTYPGTYASGDSSGTTRANEDERPGDPRMVGIPDTR